MSARSPPAMLNSVALAHEAVKVWDSQRIDPEICARQLMPLVRRLAANLEKRLSRSVELDDLIQFGLLGLLQAAKRYRGAHAEFQDYAVPRIRGAMLDGLSALDSAPLKLRRKIRRIQQCICSLEQKLTRAPSVREIAGALGLTLEDYESILRERHVHQVVAMDASSTNLHLCSAGDTDPLAALQQRYTIDALLKALGNLPKRERLMLRLRYRDAMQLDAIGVKFGVSESRVCQLLKQAMARLRARVPK